MTSLERICRKITPQINGCWLWTGAVTGGGKGYASATINKQPWRVHRWLYNLMVGDPGPLLDHVCRNSRCVNPLHVEPVSQVVNMRRAYNTETHCVRGHAKTPENNRQRKDGRTFDCRLCHNIRRREKRAEENK